ncbi:N-acetylglucosaminyl-diphospho-decaprenol L-rhamnosyltransferase [bacterium BMS3Bbin01]|nr:N-acetylglucosaminyl-diphospho-decaprenol L-rhamnosyltransferase [bacterium BMS3Bbin01]
MGSSVAVTIVNHRQWRWLQSCLRSLLDNPYTGASFEIVVLDNASGDESVDAIPELYPDVRLLVRTRRRGFGANQNTAIRATTADYVFVLNPDTVVHTGTLDRLVAAMDSSADVALAGGPILNSDQTPWSEGPLPFPTPTQLLRQAVGLHRFAPVLPSRAGIYRDHWISGSAFLLRRSVFDAVGGFDESFFLYGEETDLMRRIMDGSGALAWVPDAPVTHVGRTAETGMMEVPSNAAAVELVRGQIRYAAKHHGRIGGLVARMGLGIDALIRWSMTLVGLGRFLEAKGTSVEATRAYHLGRLVAAMLPWRAKGLAEQAADWNATG